MDLCCIIRFKKGLTMKLLFIYLFFLSMPLSSNNMENHAELKSKLVNILKDIKAFKKKKNNKIKELTQKLKKSNISEAKKVKEITFLKKKLRSYQKAKVCKINLSKELELKRLRDELASVRKKLNTKNSELLVLQEKLLGNTEIFEEIEPVSVELQRSDELTITERVNAAIQKAMDEPLVSSESFIEQSISFNH